MHMSRRILSALSIALLTLLAQGCLDVKHRYTVNPDGSGKVLIESIVKPFSLEEEETDKKKQVNKFVQDVIEGTEGIDTWKDITCKVLPDGRMSFTGTAYFSDLGEVNLKEVGLTRYGLNMANGEMTLTMVDKNNDDEDAPIEPVQLTEDEITSQIDSAREQFQMARGMMAVFLEELQEESTFQLPGTLRQVQGFTRNADGTIGMSYEGKRILEVIDSVMETPGFWRKLVVDKASGKQPERDQEMMRLIFGAVQPSVVFAPGSQPLFDYKAELAAAKKKYPALLKRFGMKKQG